MALRAGVDIEEVIHQLRGITCCPAWDNGTLVRSGPDAMALALSRHKGSEDGGRTGVSWDEPTMQGVQLGLYNPDGQSSPAQSPPANAAPGGQVMRCPDCAGTLAYQEGCHTCHGCGFSKCG